MAKLTKLKMLGTVAIGDSFVAETAPLVGRSYVVEGFMPKSYVNRVQARNVQTGVRHLFPLDMVEPLICYLVTQ